VDKISKKKEKKRRERVNGKDQVDIRESKKYRSSYNGKASRGGTMGGQEERDSTVDLPQAGGKWAQPRLRNKGKHQEDLVLMKEKQTVAGTSKTTLDTPELAPIKGVPKTKKKRGQHERKGKQDETTYQQCGKETLHKKRGPVLAGQKCSASPTKGKKGVCLKSVLTGGGDSSCER